MRAPLPRAILSPTTDLQTRSNGPRLGRRQHSAIEGTGQGLLLNLPSEIVSCLAVKRVGKLSFATESGFRAAAALVAG